MCDFCPTKKIQLNPVLPKVTGLTKAETLARTVVACDGCAEELVSSKMARPISKTALIEI